ncbi:MAG: DUF2191 domain-containing protein [bacterium]
MRTTLNIDDDLLKAAKIAAIHEGISLTEYIERALRRVQKAERGTWRVHPLPAGGPLPGLSFASASELIDQVEGPLARP